MGRFFHEGDIAMARIAYRSSLGSDLSIYSNDWEFFPDPPVINPGGVFYPVWSIYGTNDSDSLNGTGYSEYIYGFAGDDVIHGNGGDDAVYGDQGFDLLHGNHGNDQLFGGDDDDMLVGGIGADFLDGGAGNDRVGYANSWGGMTVDLTANTASGGEAEGRHVRQHRAHHRLGLRR
jgi:Ca2+-binding RTX toxin-like protein